MKRSLSTVHPEDAEILRLVQKWDRLNTRGTRKLLNRNGASAEGPQYGRSSEALGHRIGTSPRMVEKCRSILRYCTSSKIASILGGNLSITNAYKAAMTEKHARQLVDEKRSPNDILEVIATILEKSVVKTPKGMHGLGKHDLELVRLVVGHLDDEGLLVGASEPMLRILKGHLAPSDRGAL